MAKKLMGMLNLNSSQGGNTAATNVSLSGMT
jgi:hypothetical protein